MRQIVFDAEEMYVISCFESGNRETALKAIEQIIPFTVEDEELSALVISTVEKLKKIPDEEYMKLDFESYREEEGDAAK